MSKKYWPIICSKLLYKMGQDFLDILSEPKKNHILLTLNGSPMSLLYNCTSDPATQYRRQKQFITLTLSWKLVSIILDVLVSKKFKKKTVLRISKPKSSFLKFESTFNGKGDCFSQFLWQKFILALINPSSVASAQHTF